jgi:hypothetical protein
MTKKPHDDRAANIFARALVEINRRKAELLGKEQIDLMLRVRYAIHRFENMQSNPLTMREAAPLLRKALKRTEVEDETLRARNQRKQRETAIAYQGYRKIAAELIADNPKLRLASRWKLAQKVAKKLGNVHPRTILRALPKK